MTSEVEGEALSALDALTNKVMLGLYRLCHALSFQWPK